MKKLIELDAALEGLENLNAISFYEANEHSKEAYMETKGMLKTLPTVDAVEVVRCKDCKFYHRMTAETGICKLDCRNLGNDGFCSEGERKGGNHAEGAL